MGFLADLKRMAESGNYKKNKDSLLDIAKALLNAQINYHKTGIDKHTIKNTSVNPKIQ